MIPQKAGDVGRLTAAACRPECEELTFGSRLEATLRLRGFLAFVLAAGSALVAQTPQYDLILKGGHVIDPKNGVDGIEDEDVAVTGDRIAAVAANLPSSAAKKTIDVAGLYVTPGLVDMHVHVFVGYPPGVVTEGMMSMMPDHLGFRAGVTTMVDAGSSGWKNFPDLKKNIIDRSKTRVL